MARQSGNISITGTIDNLCFYQMEGKFYVRRKSSLSSKRVKKDPAFRATMDYARLLGLAAKLASQVYRTLPATAKTKGLYRRLTSKAMQWLKEGHEPEQLTVLLFETFTPKPVVKQEELINDEPVAGRRVFAGALTAAMPANANVPDRRLSLNHICHSPPYYALHAIVLPAITNNRDTSNYSPKQGEEQPIYHAGKWISKQAR